MTALTKKIKKHALPVSSMGNERTLTVVQYGPANAGFLGAAKKAYIHAGLHADEAPGFLVMHHLIDLLDKADTVNSIDEVKARIDKSKDEDHLLLLVQRQNGKFYVPLEQQG